MTLGLGALKLAGAGGHPGPRIFDVIATKGVQRKATSEPKHFLARTLVAHVARATYSCAWPGDIWVVWEEVRKQHPRVQATGGRSGFQLNYGGKIRHTARGVRLMYGGESVLLLLLGGIQPGSTASGGGQLGGHGMCAWEGKQLGFRHCFGSLAVALMRV